MTFLRDLLHEWAILPSHYDDTFPGGGGSAFAHLSEDTPNSHVVSDWDLLLSDTALLIGNAGVRLENTGSDNVLLTGTGQPGFFAEHGFTASIDGETTASTYSSLGADGTVVVSNGTGVCTLSTDNSGNLLVNGVAVTVP